MASTTVRGSLSPSRAGDFLSCPLLYRYRAVDRLPEGSTPDAVRGTLVHRVLEEVFDVPAAERTPAYAHSLVEPAWAEQLERSPVAGETVPPEERPEWLASAHDVLDRWFDLEDPTRLEPAEREVFVETLLDGGLMLRGIIDRLDVAPDGALRVVDYKGLAIATPLPTPTGWTTMRDVEVSDQLIGRDGRPTTVLAKSGLHHRTCYEVRFRDGSSVTCDNVHLWTVVHSRRQRHERITVDSDELFSLHHRLTDEGRPNSLWVEAAEPLRLAGQAELPVDPWLLGFWLGDGRTRDGELSVGAVDMPDVLARVKERWLGDVRWSEDRSAFWVTPTKRADQCTYGHDLPAAPTGVRRRCPHESTHGRLGLPLNVSLTTQLRRVGVCGSKHIPPAYLRAGTQQRIDLLRGLLDSDGWWNRTRHRAGFTTTDDGLADQVIELLRTLGISPLHFSKPYDNPTRPGRTWHVIEFTPRGFNPFSLPRKALPVDRDVTPLQRELAGRRVIVSVRLVDSVPTQCVTVDAPDSLYLCGRGLVPTHNSGRAPSAGYEARALFQLRVYALILWRTRGVVPRRLQLVYLGSSEVVSYDPDETDLLATERKVLAVWDAIQLARRTGDFEPSPGKICDWCQFHELCPAFGGTIPPMPKPPSRWTRLRRQARRRWRRVRKRLWRARRPRRP